MSENPYQAPQVAHEPPPIPLESPQAYAEEIRRQHLGQETQIKSIGTLFYLGGICLIVGYLGTTRSNSPEMRIGPALPVLVTVLQFAVGYGLTHLKTWARVIALIFAFLGLLAFPVGTLICVIMIVLLLLKKNRMIFSPEYKEIIAATPHIKRKSSIIFKIALFLLAVIILLMLLGFAMVMFYPKP